MATATNRCKMVGYFRTSTDDQLLGMDAQETTLKRIAVERGCSIVKTFTEHESGGNNERVELDRAIRHARRVQAVLVVAKLDRLSRDAKFLMTIYDGEVPVIFGDLPEVDGSAASRFMVQVMAAVAEFERRRIGERTHEALMALKARGVKLGKPENLTSEARITGARNSAEASRRKAIDEQSDILEIALPMRRQGLSLQTIADHLNDVGEVTRRGGAWNPVQVKRVLDRASREG